uniref:RRM domain-containing protein n=1 Tax=Panagrellus redivivus TaxID=6233 RepID=A0A7E4W571_PANRE
MQTVNPWVNNSRATPVMNGYHMSGHQSPLNHPGNGSANYGPIPGRQTPRGSCWDPAPHHPTGLPLNVATQWASALASSFYGSWPPNGGPPGSGQNCSPGQGKVSSPPGMWKSPPSQHNRWTPVSHEAAFTDEAKKHNFRGMPNSPQTWGTKVDQMTPWDVGTTAENQVPPPTSPNGGGWSTDPRWGMSQWRQTVNSDSDWTGNGTHPQDDSGWNVSPQEQHVSTKRHGSNDSANTNWGPQSGEAPANDMVWHDPSVKVKKHARDTGTAIWGDPETQKHHYSEIRHWKNADNSNYGYTAVPPGADWTTVNNDYHQSGSHWNPKPRHTHWVTPNAWYDPHDDKQPETLIPKLAQSVRVSTFFETLNEIRRLNPTVGKQISDQFEGAVNRKWVQPFVLRTQLSPEFAKLHQLVKRMFIKENQLLKLTTRPVTPETPLKKEKILTEMQQAQTELLEIHRIISGASSVTSPTDGQSRLRQWKSGSVSKPNNADVNGFQRGNSFGVGSGDNSDTMNAILNATNRLSINTDNVETWKQGTLDWSPPKSFETVRKSSDESNHSALHEPQEFIPGKKWEWRDPSKIAEDPNATPGSCKPNPLLTASSTLRLQLNTTPKETNNVMSPNNPQNNVDWGQMGKQSRGGNMLSSLMSPSSPHHNGLDSSQYWLLFQLDNITENQFQQICHRAGRVINFCMITPQYACVKFNTSNTDYVIQRIKSEYPFMPEQLRFVSDDEFAKMIKQARCMFDVNSSGSQQSPSAVSPWN